MTKPMIGLNTDYRCATYDRPAYSVVTGGYYDSISAAGGIPVVVPPLENDEDLAMKGRCLHMMRCMHRPFIARYEDCLLLRPKRLDSRSFTWPSFIG